MDGETYSLRVTVDAAFKEELDQLKALLAHKIPSGDLAAVLREAVRCAVEKHGKRKGALAPTRKRKASSPAQQRTVAGKGRPPVLAAVRRKVWQRDEGRCTWRGAGGRRCESTWKLELDHVHPAALGGPSTADNLRLLCSVHNQLHAEQVFGREHLGQRGKAVQIDVQERNLAANTGEPQFAALENSEHLLNDLGRRSPAE